MSSKVLVVDYGVGNLLSVQRALEYVGADVVISGSPDDLVAASRVVLPGVGAFGDCTAALRDRGLDEAIRKFVGQERPLLGICVGMQMMFDSSEEFGVHEGFGFISGVVKAIPGHDVDGIRQRVPHVGWSPLLLPSGREVDWWQASILSQTKPEVPAYFVHSFAGIADSPDSVLASCAYGGRAFVAAVRMNNIQGTQFHPEKSGPFGLAMLSEFLRS
jgi:glutamine amidotransferase